MDLILSNHHISSTLRAKLPLVDGFNPFGKSRQIGSFHHFPNLWKYFMTFETTAKPRLFLLLLGSSTLLPFLTRQWPDKDPPKVSPKVFRFNTTIPKPVGINPVVLQMATCIFCMMIRSVCTTCDKRQEFDHVKPLYSSKLFHNEWNQSFFSTFPQFHPELPHLLLSKALTETLLELLPPKKNAEKNHWIAFIPWNL